MKQVKKSFIYIFSDIKIELNESMKTEIAGLQSDLQKPIAGNFNIVLCNANQ